jgi:hypothetical protein
MEETFLQRTRQLKRTAAVSKTSRSGLKSKRLRNFHSPDGIQRAAAGLSDTAAVLEDASVVGKYFEVVPHEAIATVVS